MILANGHSNNVTTEFEMVLNLTLICSVVHILNEHTPLIRVITRTISVGTGIFTRARKFTFFLFA